MNYDLGLLFGKMCPDYIHPALADAADAIVETAGISREQTSPSVSFAEVISFVAEFYESIAVQTSSRSFPRLGSSGIQERGLYWTLSTLALHSADSAYSVCSLTEILELDAAPKYSLSPRACRGILRRAERRGRALPPALHEALVIMATQAHEETEAIL